MYIYIERTDNDSVLNAFTESVQAIIVCRKYLHTCREFKSVGTIYREPRSDDYLYVHLLTDVFDQIYRRSYEDLSRSLSQRGSTRMMVADRPSQTEHLHFRRLFGELDLLE